MIDCLINSVGLATKECECLDDNTSYNNTSQSGYYLDDPEIGLPLSWVDASRDCDEGGLWHMLEDSLRDGINDFITDFQATLHNETRQKISSWSGQVGEKKNNTPFLNLTGDYSIVQINPYHIKGARMLIEAFNLYFFEANSPTKTVEIYSSNDLSTPLQSYNVDVQANVVSHFVLPEPLSLELTDTTGRAINYYLAVDRGGDAPMNMKFWCGCPGSKRNWQNFITPKGYDRADLSTLQDLESEYRDCDSIRCKGNQEYNYGIGFTADIDCNGSEWLCANEYDFQNDPFFRVVAKVIQLYGANKLINKVLKSGNINRYTLIEEPNLYHKINSNKKQIQTRLLWLAHNIPAGKNDCLMCREKTAMVVKTIRV